MEWLDRLAGAKVGVDTAPFIYLIEEHSGYLPIVEPFFRRIDEGQILAVTSVVSLRTTPGYRLW